MKLKRTKGEAHVPAAALLDDQLSFAAKGLFAYLLLYEDLTHVTVRAIAMDQKTREEDLWVPARLLEAYGYLEDLK